MTDEQDIARRELSTDITDDNVSGTSDSVTPPVENTDAVHNELLSDDQGSTLSESDVSAALKTTEVAAEPVDDTAPERRHLSEIAGVPSGIGLALVAGMGVAALGVIALLTRRSKSMRISNAKVIPFVRTRRR